MGAEEEVKLVNIVDSDEEGNEMKLDKDDEERRVFNDEGVVDQRACTSLANNVVQPSPLIVRDNVVALGDDDVSTRAALEQQTRSMIHTDVITLESDEDQDDDGDARQLDSEGRAEGQRNEDEENQGKGHDDWARQGLAHGHGSEWVGCVLCESQFASVVHLRNHMSSVHGPRKKVRVKKTQRASKTSATVNTSWEDNQYGVIHIGSEDNDCLSDVQSMKNGVQKPVKESGGISSGSFLQCRTCSAVFSSLGHLRQHRVLKHRASTSGEDVVFLSNVQEQQLGLALKKCDYCQYTTKRRPLMTRHVQEMHLGQVKSLCKVCGKDLKWSRTLKRHYQIEHPEYLIESCPHCPYKARYYSHIKQHITVRHPNLKNCKKKNKGVTE